MSQQTEAKETWVDLEKKLLPYQRASVDKICKHFENSGKALLADEVGLGKTFVAKGVVAKLAAEHWENNQQPFRVAYICPNQNVAAQNYPKFTGMYSSGVEVSKNAADTLKKALEAYNNKNPRIPTDCVYTRLCKWLITMGEKGCDIRGAMQEKERKLYLPEENEEKEQGGISPATESASGQGKPQMRGYARDAAEVLRKKILKQFPVLQPLWDTAEKGCGSDELPKVFYAFNKAAVYYLTSQTTEDYRLSMQHLYTAEAKRRSVKKAVQFEALTPSTSFSTGNGTGTYKERALLFATLARYCGLDAPDWLKNEYAAQNKAVDGFQPAFSAYLKRLDGIFCKDMISAEVKELLCSNEEPNDFIVKLRKEFIKNNAKEFLNYDLVIMDEFQNFPELIGNGNNDKSDAAIIAQEIFGKKDCKVLLLSATPFEINDYIPEGFAEEPDDGNFAGISAERGSSDKKQVFDGFFKLIEFMIGKGERAEEWTNQWSECRSKLRDPVSRGKAVAAPSENPKDDLQRLLHDAGIFRTERMTATLRDPVSRETAVAAPSFAMRLKTNCFIGGNSKYRTAYGDSTPFPLTFGRGYSFSEEMPSLSEDWHKSLFLTEDQLSGKDVIPEGYHPRFEKLKEDILSAEGSEFSPAAMLWIPPSKPSGALRGAFKGREGYSKTLIFSHFRMTPLAFTYLLCGEAARTIKQYEQKEECIGGIDDVIEKMMPEPKYHTTHDALTGYFVELFKGDVGRAAVRSVYPEKPYPCAVEQYCEDGCFKDMIEEYIDLLAGEYGKTDAAMARAVRRAAGLRISSPKLYVRGDNPCRISEKSIQAANRFAVGLFPENETGSDLTRRMGNIKGAFNSPFWPFVFTSTSIGAEGIDLHWYARNVVHWSIPARPLDIEQREGRVLRYNCHAFRLNKALGAKKENCVRMGWQESGMFETQLNFSENSSCLQIISKAYFEEESSEQELWERALEVVKTYRKTLGATKPPDGSESNEGVELDLSAWRCGRTENRIY